jgi:hypothetical protein
LTRIIRSKDPTDFSRFELEDGRHERRHCLAIAWPRSRGRE